MTYLNWKRLKLDFNQNRTFIGIRFHRQNPNCHSIGNPFCPQFESDHLIRWEALLPKLTSNSYMVVPQMSNDFYQKSISISLCWIINFIEIKTFKSLITFNFRLQFGSWVLKRKQTKQQYVMFNCTLLLTPIAFKTSSVSGLKLDGRSSKKYF